MSQWKSVKKELEYILQIGDVYVIPEVDQFKDPSNGIIRCILDATSTAYQIEYWNNKHVEKDDIVETVAEDVKNNLSLATISHLLSVALRPTLSLHKKIRNSISGKDRIMYGVK